MSKPKYCIDTSSLSRAWNRNYRRTSFPGFWEDLRSLIEAGLVIAPINVRDEIESGEEELLNWVKEQEDFFVNPTTEEIQSCTRIVNQYPKLRSNEKSREFADPWVISIAKSRGLVVITEEEYKLNKIPDVCDKEGVSCFNMADLIHEMKWEYGARESLD